MYGKTYINNINRDILLYEAKRKKKGENFSHTHTFAEEKCCNKNGNCLWVLLQRRLVNIQWVIFIQSGVCRKQCKRICEENVTKVKW